jgi:hypothetical protein
MRSNMLDLDVCPMPFSSSRRFCSATNKLKPAWFWSSNQKNIVVILRTKSSNRSYWFWGLNRKLIPVVLRPNHLQTVLVVLRPNHWQIIPVVLRSNHWQPVPVVLMPNHWQTVHLGFEAQPRNSCSSSPCVRYKPHTTSPNLSIVRSPSTRPMLDHFHPSAPGLLLLPQSSSLHAMLHLSPAHHETSKHDSPHDIKIKVKLPQHPRFEFNPWHINDSSQIK